MVEIVADTTAVMVAIAAGTAVIKAAIEEVEVVTNPLWTLQ